MHMLGDQDVDEIAVLLREYDNMWSEKLLHKQELRRFHNYMTYLLSTGSLALALSGVSLQSVIEGVTPEELTGAVETFGQVLLVLLVPFTPAVILITSFALSELFQEYLMGMQINRVEQKVNRLAGRDLLVWEHRVVPNIYERSFAPARAGRPRNIVKLNDIILFGVAFLVCGLATFVATRFLAEAAGVGWAAAYVGVVLLMAGGLAFNAVQFLLQNEPGSALWLAFDRANEIPGVDGESAGGG